MVVETNVNDPDYIIRRDELVRIMRKQNFLVEMGFYNEGGVKGKRGRKPAPSKRIVNYDVNKSRNGNGNKYIYYK